MKIFLILLFLTFSSLSGFRMGVRGEVKAELAFAEGSGDTSDQQILQFELSGFGDKGTKTWDVTGRSADIFSDTIKLDNIEAKVYGKQDNVNLTADRGTYDKAEGRVHLEDNVVVTTDSGARLVTDSLDWRQDNQEVRTEDDVNITKENIKIVGKGIEAEPNLKKVKLNEDVKVDIEDSEFSFASSEMPSGEINGSDRGDQAAVEDSHNPAAGDKQPITITCDGALNVDYEKQIATFNKNVRVVHSQGEMYADKMVVSFDTKAKTIEKVESYGNVKIINGENTTYSQKAIYTAAGKRVVLTGRPRLVIYSGGEMKSLFGE